MDPDGALAERIATTPNVAFRQHLHRTAEQTLGQTGRSAETKAVAGDGPRRAQRTHGRATNDPNVGQLRNGGPDTAAEP